MTIAQRRIRDEFNRLNKEQGNVVINAGSGKAYFCQYQGGTTLKILSYTPLNLGVLGRMERDGLIIGVDCNFNKLTESEVQDRNITHIGGIII